MFIYEIAARTSKGQLTLPKSICQALGVDIGGKFAFDLRGNEIDVTRADEVQHEDPAIGAFLSVLEQGIQTCWRNGNLCCLPERRLIWKGTQC